MSVAIQGKCRCAAHPASINPTGSTILAGTIDAEGTLKNRINTALTSRKKKRIQTHAIYTQVLQHHLSYSYNTHKYDPKIVH